MADLVSQPTQNPSRKLSAAVISTAIVAIGQTVADAFWPGVMDQKFWLAMFPVVSYVAGYFIKDEATVVMVQNVVETEVPIQPPIVEG